MMLNRVSSFRKCLFSLLKCNKLTTASINSPIKERESRLPKATTRFEFEYPEVTREKKDLHRFQTIKNVITLSLTRIFDPTALAVLVPSMFCVYMIGFFESSYYLALDLKYNFKTLAFMNEYALRNCLASIVHQTIPADLIGVSMGIENQLISSTAKIGELANQNISGSLSKIEATYQLRRHVLEQSRCILGGFMVISQILRVVSVTMKANEDYREGIKMGEQRFHDYQKERIIRLGGQRSFVSEVSMDRMGEHILPVFENPDMIKDVVRFYSNGYKVPVYWRVSEENYGLSKCWSGFNFNINNLIRTSTNKRLLWIEADCTGSGLTLFNKKIIDLSVEDACQAFRVLPNRLRYKGVKNFRVVRVVLGEFTIPFYSGGGHSYSMRDRLSDRKEADIILDANAYVIHTILKWCRKVSSKTLDKTQKNTIIIDTNNQECFESLKVLFNDYGYDVIDGSDPNIETAIDTEEISPRLICYESTMETVNAVYALSDAHVVDLEKCCAVFNDPKGLDFLNMSTSRKFQNICTATLFDDLFREVRTWAKMGYSPEDIQHEVDEKYNNKVLSLANENKGWCSLEDRNRALLAYKIPQ